MRCLKKSLSSNPETSTWQWSSWAELTLSRICRQWTNCTISRAASSWSMAWERVSPTFTLPKIMQSQCSLMINNSSSCFKYDCISGTFIYPELETKLRKNLLAGNGKARATGFAIPVLGRLPKIFADVYLIKCKLQMTLRLLDLGTECSLRICIGKPCGGVRPLTVGHDDNVFLNGFERNFFS